MKFTKIFVIATILLTAIGSLAVAKAKKTVASEPKLKIVTTIFPEYDWTREILGSKAKDAEITLLLDNGVDLHSYQPTFKDIAKISEADVFIYVGGESDEWVDDVLKSAKNKNLRAVNLLESLGGAVKEEEVVEGMQGEDEEESEDGEEEEVEYDEHVWLSLRNAQTLVSAICEAISDADSANAREYRENAAKYNRALAALDGEYTAAISGAKKHTLLFGDRFPFRYLVDDYGLSYYAAFVGCSAETEASFETVVFLAKKLDELTLDYVLQIESGDGKIPRTIIRSSSKSRGAKILTLDSMQSTTSKDVKRGATYLGAMQKNLGVLKQALN